MPNPSSSIARTWAQFASRLRFEQIDPQSVIAAKRFLLDSCGCALGGFHHEDVAICRRTVREFGGNPEATVWTSGEKTNAYFATLLNSLAVRVMDYNDIYWEADPSHPSDLIPVAICCGEQSGRSGKEIITGIVLAYELEMRLCEFAVPGIRERGWHHASLTQIASPVVAAYMMGLSVDQTVNAIGISTCHNMTLGAVVAGKLTMMKNTVDPLAVASGVFAARLARHGYIGTEAILEGKEGFCQVLGPNWEMGRLTDGLGESWRIGRCAFKPFPTEALTHSPITAALDLVKTHDIKPDQVARVRVRTIARARDILADPTKYHPDSKETADHSLPYVIAAAIADRMITPLQFTPARIADPTLRALLPKIEVVADADFERQFPAKKCSAVLITTADDRSHERQVDFPRGYPQNPMTNADLEEKFRALTGEVMDKAAQDRAIAAVGNLDSAPDLGEFLGAMTVAHS
ncbi:MAG: MmgE/PrpD family protein [candidate division Zixibacteria bacterium]|nr:MmgE/PrpD family protein [candidate division Zixibacteria bacterium]